MAVLIQGLECLNFSPSDRFRITIQNAARNRAGWRKLKPDFDDLLSRLDCNRSPTLIRLALAILCGNIWSLAGCLQPIFTWRNVQKRESPSGICRRAEYLGCVPIVRQRDGCAS